jgi:glycosyltransferase involved in cell wall biosynthesis
MNILISAFSFLPNTDGVANVCLHHAKGFISYGHKVSIVTSKNEKRDILELKRMGFNVYEFDIYGGPNYNYKGDVYKYQQFLIASAFDMIFFHCLHSWNTDCAIPVIHQTKGKPVLVSHGYSGNIIYSIKGLMRYLSWNRFKYFLSLKKMLRSFDHIVFLADVTDKCRFYDYYITKKNSLNDFSIIPNGTDQINETINKKNFKNKYNIRSNRMIINLAGYSKLKNQIMSLKAFHKAKLKDTCLVFIGYNKNKYSEILENYCLRNNLQNVLILEKVSKEDIKDAYSSADIFLYSSNTETQPIVILDAMGAGLPFISTNVGCVKDFKGGKIVKNIQEMSDQIKFLINNKEFSLFLSEEAKEQVLSDYNWSKIYDQYEKLLIKLRNC